MVRSDEKLTIGIAVLLGVVLVAFAVSIVQNRPRGSGVTYVTPTVDADDPSRGKETATVTIIEFGDFQCPSCKLAQAPFDAALVGYGDRVRHVWKHFPLSDQHPEALNAAEAAMCSHAQGKFWEMHNALFQHQSELSEALYASLATTLGLNMDAFAACRNDDRTLAGIQEDITQANRAGVDGIPSYYVNGQPLFEVPDGENLQSLIDAEL